MHAGVGSGRGRVDGSWDPALRELAEPDWLSAADGGRCDSVLWLSVHWLLLTKPGPGWASGAMEGVCWRCTLPPAYFGPKFDDYSAVGTGTLARMTWL